jgi:predicted Zn-dependent protease
VVNPVLRIPSMDQVNFGDEASVRGEKSVAASHYKAAITVDHCNAYAWAGLGDVLLDTGSTSIALEALEATTSLMPHHFRAWTQLGEAREALGMVPGAIRAYQEALVLRQDYMPAQDGLRRAARM